MTGVQTCALPIFADSGVSADRKRAASEGGGFACGAADGIGAVRGKIGRASCRERV